MSIRNNAIRTTCEKEHVSNALNADIRLDGRGFDDFRRVQMNFARENGESSCWIEMGLTSVNAITSCKVVEPRPERPTEGFLFINFHCSQMASADYGDRPSAETTVLGRIIESSIRDCNAIDTEALCIVSGDAVWEIRIDIHVLNNSGNVLDAAMLATSGSLIHFRKPDVTIEGDRVIVHPVDERTPVPLSVHHIPISVTFGYFEESGSLLIDTTRLEEDVINGTTTFVMNAHNEVCAVHKMNGAPLDVDQIKNAIDVAAKKAAYLTDELKRKLENAEKQAENEILRRRVGIVPEAQERGIEANPESVSMDVRDLSIAAITRSRKAAEQKLGNVIEQLDNTTSLEQNAAAKQAPIQHVEEVEKEKKPVEIRIIEDDDEASEEEIVMIESVGV
eukprot:TRINITY_DN3639_c0_g1_i1.p1 TRINITY_DN3639_c0_g1~~TRINITY_DN3639_c0_g1_i1.p1  ORF type:complete len:392 (+),score=115.18 TRINITY_DN3639_c0_g1_i1:55-1230(+)